MAPARCRLRPQARARRYLGQRKPHHLDPWARVVATVLGALTVLSPVSSVAQGQMTTLNLIVSLISLVLAIAVLVLLWRKESSAYYEAVKAQRH